MAISTLRAPPYQFHGSGSCNVGAWAVASASSSGFRYNEYAVAALCRFVKAQASRSPIDLAASDPDKAASERVYLGIMASQPTTLGKNSHSEQLGVQLFYGPSSNFAFLQQIYKAVCSYQPRGCLTGQGTQDGSIGLDTFLQTGLFFGIPSKLEKQTVPPQLEAVLLAVLANGALCTTHTDIAEILYARSKVAGAMYEETVTLPAIQLSLLLAHFNTHMGRPNAAYLHLGSASRKSMAMGLLKEPANPVGHYKDLECLTLGRRGAISKGDITSCFPDQHPELTALCRLAGVAAETIQVYYHTLMLAFRPFLIAEFALRSNPNRNPNEQMWLRRAYRVAVDAAQDLIQYISHKASISPTCQSLRYHAVFIECSCGVLFYDMLCNLAKHAYNLEIINVAIGCIDDMIKGEPQITANKSIHSILTAVEGALLKASSKSKQENVTDFESRDPGSECPTRGLSEASEQSIGPFTQPPRLEPMNPCEDLYFNHLDFPSLNTNSAPGQSMIPDQIQQLFFPLDMVTPPNQSVFPDSHST
ncbi:hypothetical protein P154DRAFT_528666 [Amniculicola lignicola CBS 123094]|uniref:Transcription factor domain-containing protein n=1 Tax=Amniculicola lignicola CBS 123094 TaxID=1392246 RepID=A0A6A5X536_9PLEO|nr:hypothetical protein P154DRAFT_528666 [Amniculicola lignicola CBS 123094]